jgi:pilus assembly protein FimV
MKLDHLLGSGLLLAVLTGTVTPVSALTIGRTHSGVVLGQPLSVLVPVQLGTEDEGGSGCFSADVWYGDAQLESSSVSLSMEPAGATTPTAVRVSSVARVNEPVVTLSLQARCQTKAARKFVLLAEVVSGTEPAVPTKAAAPAIPAPGALATAGNTAVSKSAAAKPSASAPAIKAAESQLPKKVQMPAEPSPVAGQLKVVSPEVRAASAPASKPASQTAQIEELQQRVEAIAQWKAQNSSAGDLMRSDAQLQALEADLKGLQAAAAKNQQNLQMLATTVEKSGTTGTPSTLLLALSGLAAAGVGAVAYVVLRSRRNVTADADPWWSGSVADEASSQSAPLSSLHADLQTPGVQAAQAAPMLPADPVAANADASVPNSESAQVDIDLGSPTASTADAQSPAAPSAAWRSERRDFAHSDTAHLRALSTKEMLDVRQQAEFFMALGQHDEAIRLLESHITDSSESNPLVYLDLLKVFHTLSRKDEFDRYRKEFNQIFTGRVPVYANFYTEEAALEDYAEICQQIQKLWPSDDAMDYIEHCLVRSPDDAPEEGFDLGAFRDLLMLHGVLRRMDLTLDSALVPFSTARVSQSPTPVEPDAQPTGLDFSLPEPAPTTSASLSQAALDLNLDAGNSTPGNLIDFDISAYNKGPDTEPPKI